MSEKSLVKKMEEHAKTNLEKRAAGVFAVVAMAGELAIEYGILPWAQGAVLDAADNVFALWRTSQGQAASEDAQILANVAEFIDKHGDSRFSPVKGSDHQPVVRDRAGWYSDERDHRSYLLSGSALSEAGGGFDRQRVAQALNRAGWLVKKDDGRLTAKTRTTSGQKNLYHVRLAEDAL